MSERFIQADGSKVSDSVGARQTVTPRQIAKAWLAATRVIPPQFAVGTALHESTYTLNEIDVEPDGHTTGGIFQVDVPTVSPLNIGDAVRVGKPDDDPYTLDGACSIFASMCEQNLVKLFDAVDRWNADHDLAPIDRESPPRDIWSYLALAHNQGIGSYGGTKGARGTISHYGLDWQRYKAGNASWARIAQETNHGCYGDDVVSGGRDWLPEYASTYDEDEGVEIPAPLVSADMQTRIRLALVALALLLVLYAMMTGLRPWKAIGL